MGTGDLCRVPLAAVRHERTRQGRDRVGDCIRVLLVPGPRDQYSEKIRFVKEPGVQDKGWFKLALWLKLVLSPGYPTPTSKFRYGI